MFWLRLLDILVTIGAMAFMWSVAGPVGLAVVIISRLSWHMERDDD